MAVVMTTIDTGKVYVTGACDSGQLGINKEQTYVAEPILLEALSDLKIIDIAVGGHSVYFVTGINDGVTMVTRCRE